MNNLDDFSDLLSEVDLWVNKLDKLKEYIKYKYVLQNFGSKFKSKKPTIEGKINEYKNKCIRIQNTKQINMDTFFSKKKQNNKNVKNVSITNKECQNLDEEIEEEEDESENEDKIIKQKLKEKFWQLPYETLLTIEQSDFLTKKQKYLMAKRRRSLLRTVRYSAEIDNNI